MKAGNTFSGQILWQERFRSQPEQSENEFYVLRLKRSENDLHNKQLQAEAMEATSSGSAAPSGDTDKEKGLLDICSNGRIHSVTHGIC